MEPPPSYAEAVPSSANASPCTTIDIDSLPAYDDVVPAYPAGADQPEVAITLDSLPTYTQVVPFPQLPRPRCHSDQTSIRLDVPGQAKVAPFCSYNGMKFFGYIFALCIIIGCGVLEFVLQTSK